MTVMIEKEPFSESLSRELLPLAQKCWEESTRLKAESCAFYGERDFVIEPDVEKYSELDRIGSLVLLTLRDDSKLKGYVIGFTYRALHHKKIIGAIGDSIYIESEYRSYTGPLVERFLNEMTARKAGIIGWPVTLGSAVYKVLEAQGFVGDDIVMEKRLCVSLPQS